MKSLWLEGENFDVSPYVFNQGYTTVMKAGFVVKRFK